MTRTMSVRISCSVPQATSELNEAITIYNNVRMKDKNSADHVDTFLTEYTAARTLMIEQGLLIPGCPKSRARELEDLKKKLEGSNVLRYLMELPEFPAEIDDISACSHRRTEATFANCLLLTSCSRQFTSAS